MKNKTIKKTVTPTIEEQQQLLNLYNQGLFTEAVTFAKNFVQKYPLHGFAWTILGISSYKLDNFDIAIEAGKMAISLNPYDESLHFNLGAYLAKKGNFDEAKECYQNAINLGCNTQGVHYNLGNLLQKKELFEEAEKSYRLALEINSKFFEAHNNLAAVLKEQENFSAAEKHYSLALSLNPNLVEAHKNLGDIFTQQRRFKEANEHYQLALKLDANFSNLLNSAIFTSNLLCDWSNLQQQVEILLSSFTDIDFLYSCTPFPLLSLSAFNPLNLKQANLAFGLKRYTRLLHEKVKIIHSENRHQKLRIGYLSADFHSHATVYLMAGILENRNTENFDIYLYSYGVDPKDDFRSRVEKACEVFRHVRELSDEEIAQQIVADEIDILVDLKGYTEDSRLGIQVLRPAPIVVSWLGYPATLGHERLADYIIGDPTVTPLEHAEHFSETLALMPHCYQPNDNTRPIGACPTRKEAGLPETGFVFATFNQAYKITPEMFDIWCRLLEAAPNSVLWILEPHEVAQENLRREMTARGVDSSRLIFAPKMAQTEHLGRLQLVDLAVDTFPCCSHTTASDALWAGVPLVTKMGETFASRVAASILRTMDLAELVTDNDDDYFNVALSLAQNPEKLAAIKQKIAVQKQTSPLFDTQKFARDLERLYQTIWAQELKGERKAVVLEFERKSVDCEFITDANL